MVRKSLIILSILTFLYGLYYWGIPSVINIEKRIDSIESKIQSVTGVTVDIEQPKIKMGLLPAIWIMGEKARLLNKDNSEAASMEHFAIKLNFLPLLAGKLHIGNFSADSINVNMVYTKDGVLKLGQYSIPEVKQPGLKLNKAYVRLGNYKINLQDYKQNKKVLLDGKYLVNEFKNNKNIKLMTDAELRVNNKSSDIMADVDVKLPLKKIKKNQFKINGRVSDFDLSDISDYVTALPESPIESVSGKINMLAGTDKKSDGRKNIIIMFSADKPAIIYKDKARSIYCDDKIEVKAKGYTIKNSLNIKNMTILTNGVDMQMSGKVKKLNLPMPHVDLKIKINPSRTEKFIPLMPGEEDLSPDVNFLVLKKNPFYGDIKGELHVHGKADVADVDGKIVVSNGYLNAPLSHNTPLADVILDFKGTHMYLDVRVPAPINQMVYVKGYTDIYTRYADLDITSSENVDLKTAQIVLNPLHEILKFEIGPVPIMDIRGLGNIDLKVKGTKTDAHAFGYFKFRNTSASFLDIHNMTMVNSEGTLDFEDETAHFYNKTGKLNGQDISIDGTCTLKGDMDFKVNTLKQELGGLLKIIKTSPMLVDIQKLVEPVISMSGLGDFDLHLTGKVPDVHDIVFNKNLFAQGSLKLYSASVGVQGAKLTNINGFLGFDNLDANFDLTSDLENSHMKISGEVKDSKADVNISADKFMLKDGAKLVNYKLPSDLGNIHTTFDASYKGSLDKIEPQGISAKGKVIAFRGQNLHFEDINFDIKNSALKMSPMKGFYRNSPFLINLSVNNLLSARQSVNGNFNVQNFDLSSIKGLPIRKLNGTVNLIGNIKNNGVYSDIPLNGISFEIPPSRAVISAGKAQMKNDSLVLNNIHIKLDDMPAYVNGRINHIFDKDPELNLSVAAKPTQNFIDNTFNSKALYPLKVKGNVDINSNITGTLNAIHNKTNLRLGRNSSVYYMGATLGSTSVENGDFRVDISADNIIYPNAVKINNLQYNKILSDGRVQPQLSANGYIELLKNNDLKFNNFKIKTKRPTDAKIFNIIFRKPLIKQGLFTSDLIVNGRATSPKAIGEFNISKIDVPLFDATINDIKLDFKPDKIYINSKGKVITSELSANAVMRNNIASPLIFEDIKLHADLLDVNRVAEMLRDFDVDSARTLSVNNSGAIDLGSVIIKKSEIAADKIKIKNLNATDFVSHASLNDKMILDISDYKFKTAEGVVWGNIKYNLLNHKVNTSANVKNANAQIIAENLSDLKGQVFGKVNGNISLSCNGKSQDLCTQTLAGSGSFEIKDGKMPKLGSLEYLLKAGNLVKGGITGLSIKGITDLITPYKTGEFESISGNFVLKDGIAENLKIYSKGKALNIFIKGSYNINNQIADMEIFGALTNSFSSVLGKIGSASLNTLFNTIPWINLSDLPEVMTSDVKQIPNIENATRLFNAEIYGDINGIDYVKSFKWMK